MHIQAEQCCQAGIAPASQPERFQTGVDAALLFVEETVEQNDGRLKFLGGALEERGIGETGNQLSGLARQDLLAADGRVRTDVEVPATQLGAVEAAALHEYTKRVLHLGMHGRGEFVGEIPMGRMADKRLGGGQQSSVAREPDVSD